MTKLSKEAPLLFGALSLVLINEARRNEQGEGTPRYTVDELVVKLSHQAPNRIYTSPDGRICRVFLFHEDNMPYQSYIEVAKPGSGIWEKVKGEHISFFAPEDVEKEIVRWRSRFGMKGDLLKHPSSVFMATERPHGPVEYINILEEPGQTFSLRYGLHEKLGPRIREIRPGVERRRPGETLTLLPGVPQMVKEYAHPFG